MSDEHEINGAHEARFAELERQLAALQQERRPVAGSRMSRRRVTALGLALVLLAVPGVVLASHQFSDVPDSHPFHSQIGWVAEKNIADGFTDGTYRPSQAVTRQAMAAFLQRLGTASPMEEEPNDSIAAADIYPPRSPAMGAMFAGRAVDYDYWRTSHPGGNFYARTYALDCNDGAEADTVLDLYDANGVLIASNDNIPIAPTNFCSGIYVDPLASGTYFLRVSTGAESAVPWYALAVFAGGTPL